MNEDRHAWDSFRLKETPRILEEKPTFFVFDFGLSHESHASVAKKLFSRFLGIGTWRGLPAADKGQDAKKPDGFWFETTLL